MKTSPFDDLLNALHRFRDERKTLLIVMNVEVYEAMGRAVQVIESDQGRSLVVESTFGDRMNIEISQLDLKPMRKRKESQ